MNACLRQFAHERTAGGRRRGRRGLSMLELVLVLPLLLFVMALIINFGTFACWKARSEMAARHSIWARRHVDDRWERLGPPQKPSNWRTPGTTLTTARGNDVLAELDDSRLQHPIVRGPGFPLFGVSVNRDLLNPATGFNAGYAALAKRFPMMAGQLSYSLHSQNEFMEYGWEYWSATMNLHDTVYWWTWNNVALRVPKLYVIDKDPSGKIDALMKKYQDAVVAIWYAPFARDLDPLSNDDEWLYYTGLYSGYSWAPDFHPHVGFGCTSDLDYIQRRVDYLTSDYGPIKRLPRRMTRSFINLYRYAIYMMQVQLDAEPPPAADVQAELRDGISKLEDKIATLRGYLATLP
jgi:hypothetical protein